MFITCQPYFRDNNGHPIACFNFVLMLLDEEKSRGGMSPALPEVLSHSESPAFLFDV
jgi:hypothetical protein